MIRRTGGPATGAAAGTAATPGAPGKMVRAPATLRITRTPVDGPTPGGRPGGFAPRGPPRTGGPPRADGARGPRGPNLRGRAPGGPREQQPKKRERKAPSERTEQQDVKVEDTLSDGMVQQLFRLQRKMWDRKPYEPQYAPGSKAVSDLVAAGNKLFAGEVKKVKKPGRLERRIGIVGMHGA